MLNKYVHRRHNQQTKITHGQSRHGTLHWRPINLFSALIQIRRPHLYAPRGSLSSMTRAHWKHPEMAIHYIKSLKELGPFTHDLSSMSPADYERLNRLSLKYKHTLGLPDSCRNDGKNGKDGMPSSSHP